MHYTHQINLPNYLINYLTYQILQIHHLHHLSQHIYRTLLIYQINLETPNPPNQPPYPLIQ